VVSFFLRSDPARLLLGWLVLRTLMWTLAMAFGHPNAQIDMIEWGSWGGVTTWGYPKHPPLPGWVGGLFLKFSPGGVWGLYFAGYLFAAGCVWAAWKLAREFMPPNRAIFAALALDGLAYLTNDPADYSNNIVTNILWAYTAWFIYRALRTDRLAWWIAVGVVVGLAILTKYTIGVLLLPLAVHVMWDPQARPRLKSPGLYLSMLIAFGIIVPHLLWLKEHDFITFKYIVERSGDESQAGLLSHLTNPLSFIAGQAAILAPVVFILYPLLGRFSPSPRWGEGRRPEDGGKRGTANPKPEATPLPAPRSAPGDPLPQGERVEISRGDRGFLHAAVLGPVVFFLLVSFITGGMLRVVWASPLWTFAGVWLLALFPAEMPRGAVRKSLIRWLVFVIGIPLFAVGFQLTEPYTVGKTNGRTLFPGKQLSNEVLRLWHERYEKPFEIVGGEPWRAGNICVYSVHRPQLYSSGMMGYLEMDPKHTPWTNDEDFTRRGGVIVWDADANHERSVAMLKARFPTAEFLPPLELHYQTSKPHSPTRIGLAFVPPQK
jgi:4-amino-4-deoxy-L-arabinose transferase-like glycosyltransferase